MVEHLGFPQFRDTELNYGILPLPKTDEAQDRYYTPLGGYDAAFVCVPSFTADDERTSAIIEYTAYISSKVVTPAYYEVALKTKYIRDDVSGQIIDMINAACTTDFAYVYSANMNKIGTMMRELMVGKTSDFASYYAKYEPAAQKGLDDLTAKFNDLD